ncbi:hypothetical protein BH11MYX2_BH11MYX2_02410 [soil metagenome]
MRLSMRSWLALSLLASIGYAADGGDDGGGSGSGGPGGGSGSNAGGFKISGSVGAQNTARRAAPTIMRTITHVMAVQPISASPIRTIAEVKADGSFSLDVTPGQPYVFIFVDSTATGADMAVAMFRSQTLDTVAPQGEGELDMGTVEIDPTMQAATPGVDYDTLISDLGLDPAAAEFLGSIDDLSLRYANPDIDGNGMIDLVEGHQFGIDFHVRSNMRRGSASGANFTVADMTDQFFPDSGDDVATPVFNMTSAYAMYPSTMDPTQYVDQSNPQMSLLTHGAAYTVTVADGSTAGANTSFSGMPSGGPMSSWGADYDLEHNAALELPGSGGSPATLAFTLGSIGTTLTFTNVVTRTKASLVEEGTISIFAKMNTTAGMVTSVDYKWMKTQSGQWVPATSDEIAVAIGSAGGFMGVHIQPSWANQMGIRIPAEPTTGTVPWTDTAFSPGTVCGLAVSYDDKLGLRHFIGGADPNPGVSCTP